MIFYKSFPDYRLLIFRFVNRMTRNEKSFEIRHWYESELISNLINKSSVSGCGPRIDKREFSLAPTAHELCDWHCIIWCAARMMNIILLLFQNYKLKIYMQLYKRDCINFRNTFLNKISYYRLLRKLLYIIVFNKHIIETLLYSC